MATRLALAVLCAAAFAACGKAMYRAPAIPGEFPPITALWEPAEIAGRDLRLGPGGERLRPSQPGYEYVAADATGFSPGFDVRDKQGVEWSVKIGPEAQTEVVASRILWAAGFHQPPTYYVTDWSLDNPPAGTPARPGPARFRPKLSGEEIVGDWSWHRNPFIGTRPFGGLIVVNLIVTNWDWKTSNNKIYRAPDGATRYVVRDVGASFGRFTYPHLLRLFRLKGFGQGTRNDLEGFERQGFIERVRADGSVDFHYRGIYHDVVNSVRVDDVVWACERLAAVSDAQWRDAFAAGAYSPEETARFVKVIKDKIAQGLSLVPR